MAPRQDNTSFQLRWYTEDGDSYLVSCALDADGQPGYYVHELETNFLTDEEAQAAIEEYCGETITGEGPAEFDYGSSEASGLEM